MEIITELAISSYQDRLLYAKEALPIFFIMTLYKKGQDLLDIKYIIFSRSKAEGLGLAQPLSSPVEYSLLAWSRSSPEFQPWSGHSVALYSFSWDKHIQGLSDHEPSATGKKFARKRVSN